jgi:integrase
MAKQKPRLSSARKIPKVRIVRYADRPFQLRYDCPVEKRQIRISTGTRDDDEAERQKAELEAKLLLGISIAKERVKVLGSEMEWSDFREQYRTLHLATVRDSTGIHAESRLDLAERILRPKTLGDMADSNSLLQLQAKLLAGEQSRRKKPRSPHTVKGYIGCVIAALNRAHMQDWLPTAPKIRKLKTSKMKSMKGRPITEQEFEAMLKVTATVVGEAAAESWKHVLRGLWTSALRLDELMHVSWTKSGSIRPVWEKGSLPILEIPAAMQKNDTEENIPLLPWFEAVLLETPEENRKGWVFVPQSLQLKVGRKVRHQRPDAEWVGKVIARIGKEAQIEVEPEDKRTGRPAKYASAHDLRRSCGERMRNAGVPPLVICRVMRHSSWDTTRRHYAPGDIQKDAEILAKTLSKNLDSTVESVLGN